MESGEALRRVFWRNRWMLAALVVIPCVLVGLYRESQASTYVAKAEIQAQSTAPDASTQVMAILSRVTAVATSPQVVSTAIKNAGVTRDATQVAEHEVATSSFNSSAVVSLSVTDPNRDVAIRLCGALAKEVTNQLNQLGSESSGQLTQLVQQQTQLEARRSSLLKALSASGLSSTDAVAQADITELNAVETQLANNLTAQQQARANGYQGAAVISAPETATGSSRHALVDGALAAILGLIVGLLIVAVREALNPTLPDPAAGARELNILHLGTVGSSDTGPELDDELIARLRLTAERRSVNGLILTGPVEPQELGRLAKDLDDRLRNFRTPGGSPDAPLPPGFAMAVPVNGQANAKQTARHTSNRQSTKPALKTDELRVTTLSAVARHSAFPGNAALVLILPEFAPRNALEGMAELASTTGWPLFGVLGVHEKPVRRRQPQASIHFGQSQTPPTQRRVSYRRQSVGSSNR